MKKLGAIKTIFDSFLGQTFFSTIYSETYLGVN